MVIKVAQSAAAVARLCARLSYRGGSSREAMLSLASCGQLATSSQQLSITAPNPRKHAPRITNERRIEPNSHELTLRDMETVIGLIENGRSRQNEVCHSILLRSKGHAQPGQRKASKKATASNGRMSTKSRGHSKLLNQVNPYA